MPKLPATPDRLEELRKMGEEFEALFAAFKGVSENAHDIVRPKMQINGLRKIKSRMQIALDDARLLKGAFENWANETGRLRRAEADAEKAHAAVKKRKGA